MVGAVLVVGECGFLLGVVWAVVGLLDLLLLLEKSNEDLTVLCDGEALCDGEGAEEVLLDLLGFANADERIDGLAEVGEEEEERGAEGEEDDVNADDGAFVAALRDGGLLDGADDDTAFDFDTTGAAGDGAVAGGTVRAGDG